MTTAIFQETDALGIPVIDEQHRRFYEILGRLVAARAAGRGAEAVLETLDDMITYVDEHFSTEEGYMRKFDYEDYPAHRALHAGFVRKIIETHRAVRAGENALDDDLIAYLGGWFTEHIRVEDPRYVELFRAHGL